MRHAPSSPRNSPPPSQKQKNSAAWRVRRCRGRAQAMRARTCAAAPERRLLIHQHFDGQNIIRQLLQLRAGLCQLRVRLRGVSMGGTCAAKSDAGWVGGRGGWRRAATECARSLGRCAAASATRAGLLDAASMQSPGGACRSTQRASAAPHLRQLRAHGRAVPHRLAQLHVRRLRAAQEPWERGLRHYPLTGEGWWVVRPAVSGGAAESRATGSRR